MITKTVRAKSLFLMSLLALLAFLPLDGQAAASIKLLSPNGGETITVGQKIEIKWSSMGLNSNVDIVVIRPICGSGGAGYVVKNFPNTGSYLWDTSQPLLDATCLSSWQTANDYNLAVVSVDSDVYDNTDSPFSIVVGNDSPVITQIATASDGTNVLSADGTIYMVTLENGKAVRRPYTSAGAFLSYGFNSWANVVPASFADLSLPVGSFIPPQDGKIVCSDRGGDKGTCYLISQSKKLGFPGEFIFTKQGFSFSNVLYGDISFLASGTNIENPNQAHPSGSLIKSNNTVFYVSESGILGIPNLETFNSWGFNFVDVVQANAADLALPNAGALNARQAGELRPRVLTSNSPNVPINPPVGISVTKPSSPGQLLPLASLYNITWYDGDFCVSNGQNTACRYNPTYDIYVITDAGKSAWSSGKSVASVSYFVDSATSNTGYGTYLWRAGVIKASTGEEAFLGTDYNFYIVVVDKENPTRYSISPVFQITQATDRVEVSSPAYGQTWALDSSRTIKWKGGESGKPVNIYLTSQNPSCVGMDQRCGRKLYIIAQNVPNTGSYDWVINGKDTGGNQIPPGTYVVRVESSADYTNGSDSYGSVNLATTTVQASRDSQRLNDIRQLASALELYFFDNNAYPSALFPLPPMYIKSVPSAPQPADGACSSSQNTYAYTRANGNAYTLSFCLGSATGGYAAGPHILTQAGIN